MDFIFRIVFEDRRENVKIWKFENLKIGKPVFRCPYPELHSASISSYPYFQLHSIVVSSYSYSQVRFTVNTSNSYFQHHSIIKNGAIWI